MIRWIRNWWIRAGPLMKEGECPEKQETIADRLRACWGEHEPVEDLLMDAARHIDKLETRLFEAEKVVDAARAMGWGHMGQPISVCEGECRCGADEVHRLAWGYVQTYSESARSAQEGK